MKQDQVTPKVSRFLNLVCLCVPALLLICFAQGQSADDVHIVPRTGTAGRAPTMDAPPADDPSVPHARLKPIRVDVDLVLVPVAVTDTMNRPVVSLRKQDFALYEEDKRQEIRYFMTEEAPISIAVLFDVSRSMSDKIAAERAALIEFFKNANPEDEYFGISFSDRPHFLAGPTRSIDELEQKLISIEPGGSTAMLDAVYLAASEMRSAHYQRKAIVIFSDGGDNASRYSLREIMSLVEEYDAQIYAVGLFDTFFFKTIEERLGKKWLSDITDKTGGRTITVDDRAKLPEAAATISRAMRNQYVLGYRPAIGDGKWRKIKVRVASAVGEQSLQAHYKKGYYSAAK
jgi:Ca-activated chloride channel homolog